MNMNRKALRVTACCVAAAVTLSITPADVWASAPVAGVSGMIASAIAKETTNNAPTAGISSKVGDYVTKGQILGKVGPKYVDGVIGNKYKDTTRKIHKWSHNWAPFTLWYENQQ